MTTMLSQTSTKLLGELVGPKNERAWGECYRRYAPLVIEFTLCGLAAEQGQAIWEMSVQ